jgi:type IV secretion system protein VirB5
MRISMLLTTYVRRTLRTSTIALLLPLGMAVPVTMIASPALAQGVPVVDTQNIAQAIQQLRQMIEDEILQNEQLVQLREQLTTLTDQLAELQRTYEALTRLAELPEVIATEMETELNGILDQEFGDIQATIRAIRSGDFSGLRGSGAGEIETQMDRVLAELGFDEDTLSEMASSGNAGAERIATQATTGALVSAAAQNSYDDAGQSLRRVDRLVGLIDDMDELKESVDLNTRVTAELAIALVAMWQLEAVQTVGDGTGGVIDAATIAEEQNFMEFTIPDLGD